MGCDPEQRWCAGSALPSFWNGPLHAETFDFRVSLDTTSAHTYAPQQIGRYLDALREISGPPERHRAVSQRAVVRRSRCRQGAAAERHRHGGPRRLGADRISIPLSDLGMLPTFFGRAGRVRFTRFSTARWGRCSIARWSRSCGPCDRHGSISVPGHPTARGIRSTAWPI